MTNPTPDPVLPWPPPPPPPTPRRRAVIRPWTVPVALTLSAVSISAGLSLIVTDTARAAWIPPTDVTAGWLIAALFVVYTVVSLLPGSRPRRATPPAAPARGPEGAPELGWTGAPSPSSHRSASRGRRPVG